MALITTIYAESLEQFKQSRIDRVTEEMLAQSTAAPSKHKNDSCWSHWDRDKQVLFHSIAIARSSFSQPCRQAFVLLNFDIERAHARILQVPWVHIKLWSSGPDGQLQLWISTCGIASPSHGLILLLWTSSNCNLLQLAQSPQIAVALKCCGHQGALHAIVVHIF